MAFTAVSDTILSTAIFVGIAVSMFWYERELLSPGGVVVPGYTALFLMVNPLTIVYTLLVAVLTGFLVNRAARFTILFGRRRFAVTMLVSMSLVFIFRPLFSLLSAPYPFLFAGVYSRFEVVGIIVPGLIANEVHRQGLVLTLSTLAVVSVITALILLLIVTLL